MTSKNCKTGSDRVAEVSKKIAADFYINVQGDEPLINPRDIKKVIEDFKLNGITNCAATTVKNKTELQNTNIPKLVTNKENFLMYISRADIPANKNGNYSKIKKQVCIYSFSREALNLFGKDSKKTELEGIEDIEILRVIENNFQVKIINIDSDSIAVDTPEDLEKVKKLCK